MSAVLPRSPSSLHPAFLHWTELMSTYILHYTLKSIKVWHFNFWKLTKQVLKKLIGSSSRSTAARPQSNSTASLTVRRIDFHEAFYSFNLSYPFQFICRGNLDTPDYVETAHSYIIFCPFTGETSTLTPNNIFSPFECTLAQSKQGTKQLFEVNIQ